MSIQTINIKSHRQMYYLPSVAVFLFSLIYCVIVYRVGEVSAANAGYKYLIGIPNYYFFYLTILPFVAAGIMYMATRNINIRFFGKLNSELDADRKNKILFFRKLLLGVAIVFSIVITVNDAGDKEYALPPYALALASEQTYTESTHKYFELKAALLKCLQQKTNVASATSQLENNQISSEGTSHDSISTDKPECNFQNEYFDFLKQKGFNGDSISGFNSFSSWYHNSSYIYKMESFLSWVAAFVISVFFAQLFLIIVVKGHIVAETKNLVLWLLILCSFWIPCKIFSVYYHSLAAYQPPAIVWFAIFILVISVVLALFIKVEKNDMTKYATVVGAVFSLSAIIVSYINPEYFELAINVMGQLGWTYSGILLFVMAFSIYLVTDHLIFSYEKCKTNIPGLAVGDSDADKSI